jgi:DNA-binding NarL/FixJ family response regulator
MGTKRTVLLVDDHPVVCVGVRLFLESSTQFEVCGEARDVATARQLVEQLQPDLIVLDLVLGGRDGIELVEELAILHPPVGILVYSSQDEMQYARRALRAGARGYLMKSAGLEAVGEALAALARGENSVSAMVQRSLVQDLVGSKKKTAASPWEDLSDRELQIFRLLGTGLGSAEIAAELALSIKTVGTYRERLKNKLNLETARDLERYAENYIRQGIER